MGAYVKKGELETIELPDGEWVKIPKKLAQSDLDVVKNSKTESEGLAKVIRSWNIKDDEGAVLPITAEILQESIEAPVLLLISQVVSSKVRPLPRSVASTSASGLSSPDAAKP